MLTLAIATETLRSPILYAVNGVLLTRHFFQVLRLYEACSTVDLSVERTILGWAFITFKMSATLGVILASCLNAVIFVARSMDIDVGDFSLSKHALLYPTFFLISLPFYLPIYASYAQRDFERRQKRSQSPNLI